MKTSNLFEIKNGFNKEFQKLEEEHFCKLLNLFLRYIAATLESEDLNRESVFGQTKRASLLSWLKNHGGVFTDGDREKAISLLVEFMGKISFSSFSNAFNEINKKIKQNEDLLEVVCPKLN